MRVVVAVVVVALVLHALAASFPVDGDVRPTTHEPRATLAQ